MKKFVVLGIVILTFLNCNKPVMAQVDLYLDQVNVYVDDYGRIAIYSLTDTPDTIRQISRATILVGNGSGDVFDYYNDADIEEDTQLLDNPAFGDYEIYGSYNNNYSGAPPNILEKENIYCWQNQNSIIVKYTIINRESNAMDATFGLDLVPQVEDSYSGHDTVTYSSLSKIISVRKTEAVGIKPLSSDFKSLGAFLWFDGYTEDTTYNKWLTYDSFDTLFITDPNDPNVDDPVIIPAYNTQTIAPGDSVIYYIAIAYGANETEMLASMEQAQQKYNQITSVESDLNDIPAGFVLRQNYPNPFNPSTVIAFDVPVQQYVRLVVYNSIGQEVKVLLNGEIAPGYHKIDFNAGSLPSGIYFYKLYAGQFSSTKKMMLVK